MTLHQTTVTIFKGIKWSAILGGVLVLLIMTFNIGRILLRIINPPPPDYPTVAFGKLPALSFPDPLINESFVYSINTISGLLPVFPDRVTIQRIVNPTITLSNVSNARSKVGKIGFENSGENKFNEEVITPTSYKWQKVTNGLLRSITINTDTYDFKLSSTYRTYPPILNQSVISDEKNIKALTSKFLSNMAYDITDIDLENAKLQSFKLGKGGALVPAESVSATQIFRLNLHQKPINELPVFYPVHPYSSIYSLFMARSHDEDDVLEANFTHQIVATESATYPIKTADEAFEELKKGNGFISNYFGTERNIAITDVTLGYFFSDVRQGYTLPVVLFQGKGDFFAFVPALKEACLTTSSETIDTCQGKILKE